MQEPALKRTVAFFDGQNLFHAAKDLTWCTYPDYSPLDLAKCICNQRGFHLAGVRFYTGIPEPTEDQHWNQFWAAKLLTLSRSGVKTFSRHLRYRRKEIKLTGGSSFITRVGEEKGIDVRIALDVIRMVRKAEIDVALIFSQDQDFSEVADEVKTIAAEQNRWIEVASAYPENTLRKQRGINHTRWIPINRATYDSCIDPTDYHPKRK